MTPSTPDVPTVTIGMPVYNGQHFIDEAISAVRVQTFSDFELLIADNASTDETLAICRRHEADDDRIRILESHKNRGAAWNFNRLVPEARGTFFKWAAHDDVVAPEYLEKCIAELESCSDAVLAHPQAVDVDVRGAPIRLIPHESYADHDDPVVRVRRALGSNSSCVEVFGLARLDTLRSTRCIGAYTSSDRTLLLELAVRGRFQLVDEALMSRRQHEDRSVTLDSRHRNAWFDPTRAGTVGFPRWRLVGELCRSIALSPVKPVDRIRMSSGIATFAFRSRNRLVRELAAWPVRTIQRFASKETSTRS